MGLGLQPSLGWKGKGLCEQTAQHGPRHKDMLSCGRGEVCWGREQEEGLRDEGNAGGWSVLAQTLLWALAGTHRACISPSVKQAEPWLARRAPGVRREEKPLPQGLEPMWAEALIQLVSPKGAAQGLEASSGWPQSPLCFSLPCDASGRQLP